MEAWPDKRPFKNRLTRRIRAIGLAGGFFRLFRTLILVLLLVGLSILSFCFHLPWPVSLLLLFIALCLVVIDILVLKRFLAVDLEAPYGLEEVRIEPDERIEAVIPAVIRQGIIRSWSALGAGQVMQPENALLVTDRSIWAITVPLEGSDRVLADLDIGKWQWLHGYREIRETLSAMREQLDLKTVLELGRGHRLMGKEEVREVRGQDLSQILTLVRQDGRSYRYAVRLKEDYDQARKFLQIHGTD